MDQPTLSRPMIYELLPLIELAEKDMASDKDTFNDEWESREQHDREKTRTMVENTTLKLALYDVITSGQKEYVPSDDQLKILGSYVAFLAMRELKRNRKREK